MKSIVVNDAIAVFSGDFKVSAFDCTQLVGKPNLRDSGFLDFCLYRCP